MRLTLLIATLCGVFGPTTPVSVKTSSFLKGDYVEARTASVFAGACHYNSELMTSGRDAILAWNVTAGSWNQTNLAGVRVVALVTSDANLADDSSEHSSEIAVDASASSAQAAAVVQAIKAQCGSSLGRIMAVRRVHVSFADSDRHYTVSADGFASLDVQAMPNDECCKQPSMVWYTPFVSLQGRKVGYTNSAACLSATLGDTWDRHDENSAFYGSFSF